MPRGNLTDKQILYAELVASGIDEVEAVVQAGYSEKRKYQALTKLRSHKRVLEKIAILRGDDISTIGVANRCDRETFWTDVMNDPSYSANVRLEASKLLGKAQGDFVVRQEIKTETKIDPVVLIPNLSPEQWEEYWEKEN